MLRSAFPSTLRLVQARVGVFSGVKDGRYTQGMLWGSLKDVRNGEQRRYKHVRHIRNRGNDYNGPFAEVRQSILDINEFPKPNPVFFQKNPPTTTRGQTYGRILSDLGLQDMKPDEVTMPRFVRDAQFVVTVTEEQMSRSSDLVKQAFSLANASPQELRKANQRTLVHKLGADLGPGRSDTGSVPVQIGCLSERISALRAHLAKNRHDVPAKVSLSKTSARRRRVMMYLKRKNLGKYMETVKFLGIRHASMTNPTHLKGRGNTYQQQYF